MLKENLTSLLINRTQIEADRAERELGGQPRKKSGSLKALVIFILIAVVVAAGVFAYKQWMAYKAAQGLATILFNWWC
jgi:hypothetical protein